MLMLQYIAKARLSRLVQHTARTIHNVHGGGNEDISCDYEYGLFRTSQEVKTSHGFGWTVKQWYVKRGDYKGPPVSDAHGGPLAYHTPGIGGILSYYIYYSSTGKLL